MVAKVISGKNIRGALNYNENKVKEGKAICILASRFASKPTDLSFSDKLNRFYNLVARNPKTKTNALHISLNFDVTEKLDVDKLSNIAITYMDKIGFGTQPYLVYQHSDAAHPHIHIITTNIQSNGKRIDIHNIGRNQSEKARKEIEKAFGLVRAESKKKNEEIHPVNITQAIYGKSETKRSISNIVRTVTRSYRYTSLPELNAALRQFNVIADRGKEGTLIFDKKGLQYSLLDPSGKKVGIPVKASAIYGKPTLKYLEKQFKLNEALRTPHKERLKKCIDNSFKGKRLITRTAFERTLAREGIYVLFRQNEEMRIYGITFVDNKTKVVFNGSDLGKAYSAKAITERLTKIDSPAPRGEWLPSVQQEISKAENDLGVEQIVIDLTKAEAFDHQSPDTALKRRRKKRKRKGKSL